MEALIDELLKAGTDAYKSAGVLASVGVALSYAIRCFRQFGGEAQWGKLTPLGQLTCVFALSCASAVFVAVAGGATWGAAIPGAIAVAVTAVATHKGSQMVGKALPLTGSRMIDTSIRVAFNKDLLPTNVVPINRGIDKGM